MTEAIAKANAALDAIGAQDLTKVSLQSTIGALDDLAYQASLVANRAAVIKESNTDPAMRTAAENAIKVFQEWAVGTDYREDVYKAMKAFEDTKPKLTGEDQKLVQRNHARLSPRRSRARRQRSARKSKNCARNWRN